MRQPRDHAPRAGHCEHAVHRSDRERRDPERQVEDETDEASEEQQEHDEAEDDDDAAEPVGADLLLEGHVPAANETSGTAVSPCAEKNSRSRKPNGLARSSQGMLWIAVFSSMTVAL